MMLATHKKIKGFTLIELLMVVALSSIVLFGVFQGYYLVKNTIIKYYQMVRLQNNIKLITHELYNITGKAGKFGCAATNQPLYLHVSKKISPMLIPSFFISNKKLQCLIFFKKSDPKLKGLLPHSVFVRLKPKSDILYTLSIEANKLHQPKEAYRVYADCQDVFILSHEDPTDYFIQSTQFNPIGNLAINLYYVAQSKRKNNQDQVIYSLYQYNEYFGGQEIIEGVEELYQDPENSKKIKILLTSVEGHSPLKQWLTIGI